MNIQLLLLCSAVVCISHGKHACNDECGLEKAESSLRIALGVLKLVKDDQQVNSKTSNNDDIKKNPSPRRNMIETPNSSVTTEIRPTMPTSMKIDPINKDCDQTFPATCADILVAGYYKSGVYTIYPRWTKDPIGVNVYCDQSTQQGGWTVIQRRKDYEPRQSFNQTFETYAKGFGTVLQEFWIGNEIIHTLTTQDRMILRIDLEDWEGQKRFVHYKNFTIAGKDDDYKMSYPTFYDSTAGSDSFSTQFNKPFVTYDKDTPDKLASFFGGGLWMGNLNGVIGSVSDSISANLNGIYYPKGQHLDRQNGLFWKSLDKFNSLKRVEMKLRPEYFVPSAREELYL